MCRAMQINGLADRDQDTRTKRINVCSRGRYPVAQNPGTNNDKLFSIYDRRLTLAMDKEKS